MEHKLIAKECNIFIQSLQFHLHFVIKKFMFFCFQIINKKFIVNVISLENLNIKQMLSVKM